MHLCSAIEYVYYTAGGLPLKTELVEDRAPLIMDPAVLKVWDLGPAELYPEGVDLGQILPGQAETRARVKAEQASMQWPWVISVYKSKNHSGYMGACCRLLLRKAKRVAVAVAEGEGVAELARCQLQQLPVLQSLRAPRSD